MSNNKTANAQASLFRRLAALSYDSFLAVAIIFLVASLYVAGAHLMLGGLPESAISLQLTLFPCVWLGVFLFYAVFWRQYGRTLGMQTWRLRLVSTHAQRISWRQCMIRFVFAWLGFALGGIGYWWALFDAEKRCWHDRVSDTRVIRI